MYSGTNGLNEGDAKRKIFFGTKNRSAIFVREGKMWVEVGQTGRDCAFLTKLKRGCDHVIAVGPEVGHFTEEEQRIVSDTRNTRLAHRPQIFLPKLSKKFCDMVKISILGGQDKILPKNQRKKKCGECATPNSTLLPAAPRQLPAISSSITSCSGHAAPNPISSFKTNPAPRLSAPEKKGFPSCVVPRSPVIRFFKIISFGKIKTVDGRFGWKR